MSKSKEQVTVGRKQTAGKNRWQKLFCLLPTAVCLLLTVGCRQDMQDQPRHEAFEADRFFKDGSASRTLVPGTVPRGYLREDTALFTGRTGTGTSNANAATAGPRTTTTTTAMNSNGSTASSGQSASAQTAVYDPDLVTTFPFPITEQVLKRGQERYGIYCSVCHGATGEGDGLVVRRGFRKPPSYHTDQLRAAPLGHFFDVITNGWGAMPSYGDRVPAQDRWAIIAYIRALQLSYKSAPGGANAAAIPQSPVPVEQNPRNTANSNNANSNSRSSNTGAKPRTGGPR